MSLETFSTIIIGIEFLKKHLFNGKEETSSRPRRMTPHLWKLEYDRLNCRGNIEFFVRSLNFYFDIVLYLLML